MRNKEFFRRALFLVFSLLILAKAGAQITVKGQVINGEDNSPIPFVTVYEKGKTNGVVTDVDGRFSINLGDSKATIVASSLGYKTQEINATVGKDLRFILFPDLISIDEVVVTALGISREKKALSYSVQDVKGAELTKSRQTN
ncbi:MAG: carboxypeptidase-like regulatory domain-containing protein, partial [Tannerellaceae bacterium]|nr:carboxypeptidase-like regulatory domain-containing protein [Tannerellaceae bacterium]